MLLNLLGILCLALSSLVYGQSDNDITNDDPVSILVSSLDSGSTNYVFALNIPSGSEDIFFHLSSPAAYSWVGVGTGSKMKDSLMFIVYLNSSGNGVTLSPRLSTGEVEPTYSSTIDVETLPGSGLSNGTMTVNARCSNCQRWSTGSLDLASTSQPMLYALGPSSGDIVKMKSDSPSANLERHSIYGTFFMNMSQATGGIDGASILSASLESVTTSSGASTGRGQTKDTNWQGVIHAVALSGAIIILMPTGAVYLRIIPASVRWHWVNQSLATIIAGIGFIIGFWMSTMYNKSKSFNSPHQILGLICFLAIILQWGLGFWHHLQYKRTQKSTRYGSIHVYLGRGIPILAIVVGAIGLVWSSVITTIVIIYVVISSVIVLAVFGFVIWKGRSLNSLSFLPTLKRSSHRSVNSEESYEHLTDPSTNNRNEYHPYGSNMQLGSFSQPNERF